MNGVIKIVLRLSLSVANALAAMTAGTVHPKPRSIGRNAFPESPTRLMVSFMT